jgi:Bacteriocin-protection, YdeI or OmpD-Associated/Domain of unknown function (DUF1905)
VRFSAELETNGRTATGFEVPADIVAALGAGKRPAVRVTFNDYSYRSTVAPMGGRFLIPVSAAVRAASGASAGDRLDVEIELDTEPRTIAAPDDLVAELDADPALRAAWDRLSFTHQREHVEVIESAKRPETRQRRIAKALEMIRSKA